MFDKLKKAFSRAAKSVAQKELTEKVLDDVLLDLQIALLESDVAQEVVDDLSAKLKKELLGLKLEKEQEATEIVQSKLRTAVAEIFAQTNRFDLIEKIKMKKEAKGGPFVVVFLGINGTGKTTTVAKIANLLRKAGFSVVVAAGDTHRAGAIEQLEQHTNRLSLKIVKQRYGADPSSVGRDAYDHAKRNHIDIVLMDTAGRMQTSKNLMDEMGKIVRVVKPDVKLFIGDALAGNDTINQAREFFHYTNFDGAILTKVDADAKEVTSIQKISELAVEKTKSADPQTVREEEKDIVLLSQPPVKTSNSMDGPSLPEQQQAVKELAPQSSTHQPEPYKMKEQPKEKKSRFGFFGKKRTNEDRSKKEEEEVDKKEKYKQEERAGEEQEAVKEEEEKENERARLKEEEEKRTDKQRNLREDGDTKEQEEEDKVIYLTDEDIEDLLK